MATMKRAVKISFWTLTLLFWGGVCLLLCEYWERTSTRHAVLFDYASPIIRKAEQRDLDVMSPQRTKRPATRRD